MLKFRKFGKISRTLHAINTLPLLILSILAIVFSSGWFYRIIYSEIETEMKNVAACITTTLELTYPGDYELVQEENPQLHKGGYNLSDDYTLLDSISAATGFHLTIFYQDIRVLTTLRDESGQRLIGTPAPDAAVEDVLKGGESHFYKNALINDSRYFSLYIPLHNSDNTVAGMLFVGKSRESVDDAIQSAIFPMLVVALLSIALVAFVNFSYNKRFVSALLKIHVFLAEISKGNLSAELDSSVLDRRDELGEIGRSVLHMRRSLSTMIEQDELTKLYNRRFGERMLLQVISQSAQNNTPFCVAMGDIDSFKNVNDTYSHECGDVVLRTLSSCLQRHMKGKGFAARFGGEEFLLVYENRKLPSARADLEQLLQEIRDMECTFEGHTIRITMTFGLIAGGSGDMPHLLREADTLLYRGKANGRNRIEC